MFDRVLLLSEGRTIFLGPARDALGYFAAHGFKTPAYFNPADFFLDVLSPDTRSRDAEIDTGSRILALETAWKQKCADMAATVSAAAGNGSPTKKKNTEVTGEVEEYMEDEVHASIRMVENDYSFERHMHIIQLLTFRSISSQFRNPAALIIRTVIGSVFGAIIGGMYSNISDDQRSIMLM
jgi:ATP-binding cassette, subfamily G (WHITE), member 2